MANLSAFGAFIIGALTFCLSALLYAFLFGTRAGNIRNKVENSEKRIVFLEAQQALIRTAFEAYTGVSLEGVDFRKYMRKGEKK